MLVLLRCADKCVDEFLIVKGLDHKVCRTLLDACYGQLYVSIGRKQHHCCLGRLLENGAQPKQPLVAIVDAAVEVHVEQYHVRLVVA